MMAAFGVAPDGTHHGGLNNVLGPNRRLENDETDEIHVPEKMVGSIIGRGGEQIKRLQRDSGAKIYMVDNSRGLPYKRFRITGARDKINHAKEMIFEIVPHAKGPGERHTEDRPRMEGPVGPPDIEDEGSDITIEISIPGPKIGRIIGKGGETIKHLMAKSGTKMVIITNGPQQENEKPLRITGESHNVEKAKKMVNKMIADKKQQVVQFGNGDRGLSPYFSKNGDTDDSRSNRIDHSRERDKYDRDGIGEHFGGGRSRSQGGFNDDLNRNGPVDPGGPGFEPVDCGGPMGGIIGGPMVKGICNPDEKVETFFAVPSNKCGLVIGKGGETIKNINQQSGAYCKLNRIPPNKQNEKIFIIRGTFKEIDNAKEMIAEKAQMCYMHSSTVQKEAAIRQDKTIMKNCSGYLVRAERNGVPSVALYIDKLDCLIEIDTQKNAKYYENGQVKPVYNLQTKLSVHFDMVYNSKKRRLEAISIWVGERPSKKRLQALKYSSQIGEEIRKRRRIQKQERQQYIYRKQMSKLNIMLKRYLKKIPVNYNLVMFNFKLLRKKSWYKNKIMKKKLKFKNFILEMKEKHDNDCKMSKKRKTRGIKPSMSSSNSFIENSTHSFSSPTIRPNIKPNQSNKSNIKNFKCLHQNIIDSNNKLSSKKERRIDRKKVRQCPAGSACLLVTSHNSELKILDPYMNSKLNVNSSLQFWSNKKNMNLDQNLHEALFQKVDKKFIMITENVIRIKKNSSEIKQLMWTDIHSKGVLKEDSGAMMLPACIKNLRRMVIEKDLALKHLQMNPSPELNYQIPSTSSSVRKYRKKQKELEKKIYRNNNVKINSNVPIVQKPLDVFESSQIKDDMNEPIRSFRIPVPLKPILKDKSNNSRKKSSKKKN